MSLCYCVSVSLCLALTPRPSPHLTTNRRRKTTTPISNRPETDTIDDTEERDQEEDMHSSSSSSSSSSSNIGDTMDVVELPNPKQKSLNQRRFTWLNCDEVIAEMKFNRGAEQRELEEKKVATERKAISLMPCSYQTYCPTHYALASSNSSTTASSSLCP